MASSLAWRAHWSGISAGFTAVPLAAAASACLIWLSASVVMSELGLLDGGVRRVGARTTAALIKHRSHPFRL
jgi:hypothetical protein